MQIRDLIPWGRDQHDISRQQPESANPVINLQRDINRVFDGFWSRFEQPFGAPNGFLSTGIPKMDVSESDEEVEIAVELPGMDEKDIEVDLREDILTIRGEKKDEKEQNGKGYYLHERSFGAFHRNVPLPPGVDTDKASATFRKGVLTVTIPKTPEAREKVKKIEVKAA